MEFETEEKLLNYLMTSEFEDTELSPDEMREMLIKFRYFYRLTHSQQQSLEFKIDTLERKLNLKKQDVEVLQQRLNEELKKYNNNINRKLTLKERLQGKVFENRYHRNFKWLKWIKFKK